KMILRPDRRSNNSAIRLPSRCCYSVRTLGSRVRSAPRRGMGSAKFSGRCVAPCPRHVDQLPAWHIRCGTRRTVGSLACRRASVAWSCVYVCISGGRSRPVRGWLRGGGFPFCPEWFAARRHEIGGEFVGRRLAGGVVLPQEIEERYAVCAFRQSTRSAMAGRAIGGEKPLA